MARTNKVAAVNGMGKLATMAEHEKKVQLIRAKCAKLKKAAHWSPRTLMYFVRGIGTLVGVDFSAE